MYTILWYINLFLEREYEVMKHFFKGAIAVAIVMVILIIIHIFFNMKGIDLNRYINNIVETMLASSFAMLIYQILIKNENKKEDRE